MSPEQCRGQDVDHRTDVYALGIITFEMFAGALPYTAGSYIELVNKHLFASPPNPSELNADIPTQLEAFILRCIAKNPEERPASMAQFRSELSELVPSLHKTHPTSVRMPRAVTPSTVGTADAQSRSGGGRLGLMLGLLGLLVLAGVGVGAYVWYASRPPSGGGSGVSTKKGTGPVATADSGASTAPVTSGKLKLTSAPVGAVVLVDGVKQQGVTPLTLELKSGQHKLVLRKAGHQEHELTLEIEAGKERAEAVTLEATAAAPVEATASIAVQVNRSADFYIDGEKKYTGSLFKLASQKPGKYELKIVARGRKELIEVIELKPGKTFTRKYKLKRRGGGKRPPRNGPDSKKPGQKDVDDTLDPFGKKK